MGTEIGSTKVYRADGALMWGLDGDRHYITEGVLTQLVGRDGRRLVEMHGGEVYVALDGRWRATRAEALADVRTALECRAAKSMERLAADVAKVTAEAAGGPGGDA